jgi:hypothetical protein
VWTVRVAVEDTGRGVGKLADVVRLDNYKRVIPVAGSLEEAIAYICRLYGDCEGVFTAYHVE